MFIRHITLIGRGGALSALMLALAMLAGCGAAQDEDEAWPDSDGEEHVAQTSLASTFNCAAYFGLIGEARFLTGNIRMPGGATVPVTTVPRGSSTIQCSGGPTTIQWEPITLTVPLNTSPNGTLVLSGFTVNGTPGQGPCPAPSLCYPDADNDGCADDTTLLTFNPQACTVAEFTSFNCELSSASTNVCGTI
jgi:hypothetical protein